MGLLQDISMKLFMRKRRLGVYLKEEVHTASGWVGKSMSTIGGLGGPKSGG